MAVPLILTHPCDRRIASVFSGVSTFLLLFCWLPRIAAQTIEPVTEESVKAAYLYRFADYVRWPSGMFGNPAASLTVAVVGDARLANELQAVTSDRTVDGRQVAVRELTAGEQLEDVHILFVSAESMDDFPRLREAARSHATLLVTESRDALKVGSVINFTTVDRRVRFEVSLNAAEQCNVKLSSQLLAVAERVERGAN